MNENVSHFLEWKDSHPIYRKLQESAFDVMFNLEMLFENQLDVDIAFHDPKRFVVQINNFVRNIVFFVEMSLKQKVKYPWLYSAITELKERNLREYEILRKLRNNSFHQELIVPDGAIAFGLYRTYSSRDYKLKIGMGKITETGIVAPRFLYSPTREIFHELLLLHYWLFMDLGHSALNECLGVSRAWKTKVKVNLSDKKGSRTEIVDIYELTWEFFDEMFSTVTKSFAQSIGDSYEDQETKPLGQFNYVNTLLEIDLYPDLFSEQWGGSVLPLNLSERMDYQRAGTVEERNRLMISLVGRLPRTKTELLARMTELSSFSLIGCEEQSKYDEFLEFAMFPHWFMSCLGNEDRLSKIGLDDLLGLVKMTREYFDVYDRNFEKTEVEKKELVIRRLAAKIEMLRRKVEG